MRLRESVRLGRAAVAVCVAVLGWAAALVLASRIPGSPFERLPGVVDRMADPQTGPEAFEEFLALPLEGVASTAFPFFAALAVVLVSRMWLALTHRELGLVALGFAAFVLVWGWIHQRSSTRSPSPYLAGSWHLPIGSGETAMGWGTPYERLAKSPPGDGLAA